MNTWAYNMKDGNIVICLSFSFNQNSPLSQCQEKILGVTIGLRKVSEPKPAWFLGCSLGGKHI